VRPQASLLLLLAGLLGTGASKAAQAAPQGQMGATAKGSITISVSVRPQVQLWHAAVADQPKVTAPAGSAQHICLVSGNSPANYAVLLQSDGRSADEPAAALATSEAATSFCRSAEAAGAVSAGFRLPPRDPARRESYTLLIAPE
jgi:hypothetical protein